MVKLNKFNDSIDLGNGQKLYLETKFTPAENTQVIGTVHAVPESLYFNKKDRENSMEWETAMELEKGDTVFMEYFAVLMCLGTRYDQAASYPNETFVEDGDAIYIFIPYADIYFRVRNGNITPVNGYCIAKGIDIGLKSENIIIPDNQKVVWSPKWAELIEVGRPNTGFLDKKHRDVGELKKGDIVRFKGYANQRIEDSLHRTLFKEDKNTPYVVVQRRWMQASLPNKSKCKIESRKIE